MSTSTQALAKATQAGDVSKLPDKTKTAALEAALKQADRLKDNLARAKENAGHAGMLVVHTAETQGTLALASFADGAMRAKGKKLKLGPVPVRAALGVLVAGWGMYDAITEGRGTHQIAVANGLIGSELASLAMEAGATVMDKWSEKKAGETAPADPSAGAAAPGAPTDMTATQPAAAIPAEASGPIREIHAGPAKAEVVRLFDRRRAS